MGYQPLRPVYLYIIADHHRFVSEAALQKIFMRIRDLCV